MPNHSPAGSVRAVLIGLTVVLAVWAAYLAVGAYFGGGNLRDDWRRSLVVLACMAGFLGVWWILLLVRAKRPPSAKSTRPGVPNSASNHEPGD